MFPPSDPIEPDGGMRRDGTAMKAAREEQALSRRELARRLHMSHSILADYENGQRRAPPDVVQAYERELMLSPGSFLDLWEQARQEPWTPPVRAAHEGRHQGPDHTPVWSLGNGPKAHDVFICHASEDKLTFAKPLADALRRRDVHVWYDEFSIDWGDSLRRKIDEGVATCRYGLVVLSPAFFAKRWTQYELDGLAGRELATGSKVILPIWHGVRQDDVARYSPSLAERSALMSAIGVNAIASEVQARLRG